MLILCSLVQISSDSNFKFSKRSPESFSDVSQAICDVYGISFDCFGYLVRMKHKFIPWILHGSIFWTTRVFSHTHSFEQQSWMSYSFRTVKIVLVMRYKVQSFNNTVWSTASCFRDSVLTFGLREAIMENIYKACKNFPIISVFIPSSDSEITFFRLPLVRRKILQDTEEKG